MLLLIALWAFIFFVFYVTGISASRAIVRAKGGEYDVRHQSVDEVFFLGFLFIGAIACVSSIFFPIGEFALGIVSIAALAMSYFNFPKIRHDIYRIGNAIRLMGKWELMTALLVAFLAMTIAVSRIMPGDTGLYYVQNIQWIRHYAVVPGLGNLHGRFAFNSHFLVLSSVFAVSFKKILIFPVNAVCFLVVIFTLYREAMEYLKQGKIWIGILYGVSVVLIVRLLPERLNTPAPDLICALLVIYSFLLLLRSKLIQSKQTDAVLLNLLVFTCVSFKLSSCLLLLLLPFLWKGNVLRQLYLSVIIGAIIILPYLIRNFYLSGYLIYPFPALDIFSVDWKIPLGKVLAEKEWVETWAKIRNLPSSEVVKMSIREWFPRWFKAVGLIYKVLLTINLSGLALLVIAYLKNQSLLLKLQLVLLVNLLFWFKMAPDPRFAVGFIVMQFAFILASLLEEYKLFSTEKLRFAIIATLLVVCVQYRGYAKAFFSDSALWLMPAPYVADSTVKVRQYHTNFDYQVPVIGESCYNVLLPCTPFANDSLLMRGKQLQDGFYIVK